MHILQYRRYRYDHTPDQQALSPARHQHVMAYLWAVQRYRKSNQAFGSGPLNTPTQTALNMPLPLILK